MISIIEKQNFVCYGCGDKRPCFVECNQEKSSISYPIEDLKCILDETNQTGYKWEYYSHTKPVDKRPDIVDKE